MQTTTNFLRNTLTAVILILTVSAINAAAATFTVTNTNNTGAGSLRQAVTDSNTAAGSDTIVFDSSFSTARTITLTSGISVFPATGESLTINGPGANLLTISGGGTTELFSRAATAHGLSLSGMTLTMSNNSGIVNPNSGAQSSLTVTNVAFVSNAQGFGGGGISNAATLTVTGCTFTNNETSSGGGSGNNGGGAIQSSTDNASIPVTISNSTFTGNTANSTFAGGGGAIKNKSGSMTITNSTFTNNTALGGGAVSSDENISITGSTFTGNSASGPNAQSGQGNGGAISGGGQVTINSSVITGNSAFGDGGGIYVSFGNITTITNSTISNNTANSDSDTNGSGGGLFLRSDSGTTTISGSTIDGNRANSGGTSSGFGGGINIEANLNLTNSTVSGNFAARDGGGIYDSFTGGSNSNVAITSSTIVNNTATLNGGGLRGSTSTGDAPTSLRNTIIANNTANGGTSPEVSGAIASQGYNLIRNTTGATITGDTTTNITGLDPQLGPLANNGGPTQTHALMVGSPAVDKGNSFGITTDQRGMMRPSDLPNANYPNATGGDGADIGAFEIQIATASSVTVSGRVLAGRRGVSRAVVYITDNAGNSRTTRTDKLGYYRFEEVEAGQTYIFNVYAKLYQFDTQVITVTENLENLNFSAQR